MNNFEIGTNYQMRVSYPSRFLHERGKVVEWSKGFTGILEGTIIRQYSTARETFTSEMKSANGGSILEEWDRYNNLQNNPEISKFWNWITIRDEKGWERSIPTDFIIWWTKR